MICNVIAIVEHINQHRIGNNCKSKNIFKEDNNDTCFNAYYKIVFLGIRLEY